MVMATAGNKCHEPCREASAAALAWLSSDDAQSGTSSQLQSLLLAVQDGILTHLPLPLRGAVGPALRCYVHFWTKSDSCPYDTRLHMQQGRWYVSSA
jgi:hypothetical protein